MKEGNEEKNINIFSSYNYKKVFDLLPNEESEKNETLSNTIYYFKKHTIHSTFKINEQEFIKALKSNYMLRNLIIHNILIFDNGDLKFNSLNFEKVDYNLNTFFYVLKEYCKNHYYDSTFIAILLLNCYNNLIVCNDKKESDKITIVTYHKDIISDKTIQHLYAIIAYILLSSEEKEICNQKIDMVLKQGFSSCLTPAFDDILKNSSVNSSAKTQYKNEWLNKNKDITPQRRNENPYKLSFNDIMNLKDDIKNTHIYNTTFAQDVLDYCYRQGIFRGVDFENETYINQNEFSKLSNNINHIPEKRIAISICVGLRLTYTESVELLSKAGYLLSTQISFDKFVMEKSLMPRFYDIEILNKELEHENIKERLGSMPRGAYNTKKQKEI